MKEKKKEKKKEEMSYELKYEFKKCPFCDGDAKIKTGCYSKGIGAFIKCNKCKASTDILYDVNNDGMFIANVIEAWNRRVKE